MRNSLKAWLVDTIEWKKFSEYNEYSEPSYQTGVTVACRIIYKTTTHRAENGDYVNTEYIIYFEPTDVSGIGKTDAYVIDGKTLRAVTFHLIEDNLGNPYAYEVFI